MFPVSPGRSISVFSSVQFLDVLHNPQVLFEEDRTGRGVNDSSAEGGRQIAGIWIAGVVVINETIEYWLEGLADGSNGEHPERRIRFPYLQDEKDAEPLTMTYSVFNQDETRSEIRRFNLEKALMELIENDYEHPARVLSHASVVSN